MSIAQRNNDKSGNWASIGLLLLFFVIPYGYSALTGTAEAGLSGLKAFHSAAESVYCAKGVTTVSYILLVELVIVFLALVINMLLKDRLGGLSKALKKDGWHIFAVLVLGVIPFVIAWNTESSVCTRGKAFFWESVFIDVFILSILAISYNLLFGFSGVLSFGHAAFFGMGAYTVGLLMMHLEWPWWLATISALVVGVLIALFKGYVGLRIRGLYFALFTLAFAEIFFMLAGNRIMVDITGAEDGFTFSVPDWLNITKNRLFYYYLVLIVLIIAFLLVRRLMNSPTGRVLIAMRDNEDRAQMIGYNTFRFQLIALVIGGVIASGAGVLRGIALKGVSPNVLGISFTMDPLLMTLMGGAATFAGPIVGAFGLRLTEQVLRDTIVTIGQTEVNIGEQWSLILGVIFIIIVLAFPQGIVGTIYARGLNTRAGWRRLLRREDKKVEGG
jgi:branched-chain amino acid transport system permease protein